MKTTKFLRLATLSFALVIICISCKEQAKTEHSELTPQEKEQAKKEISSRIDGIVQGAKNLNIDEAMKAYSNSDDFMLINPDGSSYNYQEMKTVNSEAFEQLRSLEFSTVKKEYRFLAKDLVLCTWFGKNKMEFKTGDKLKTESYVGSMLFKKENEVWSIIYAHESNSTPIQL
ncbi:nuclear transport factor 2 family protein [Mariniflexile sp.]|uniref:nuclear transport factor 2 family protein n=1 Tax=Mariniflexile sp. TaxID=1979402 RepID=UPI004048D601